MGSRCIVQQLYVGFVSLKYAIFCLRKPPGHSVYTNTLQWPIGGICGSQGVNFINILPRIIFYEIFYNFKVIGNFGGVEIFDVADAIVGPSQAADFRGVKMASITVGDSIDLTSGNITFANWKYPMIGQEVYDNVYTSNDIFSVNSGGQWRKSAESLTDAINDDVAVNVSVETGPQFEVVLNKTQAVTRGG